MGIIAHANEWKPRLKNADTAAQDAMARLMRSGRNPAVSDAVTMLKKYGATDRIDPACLTGFRSRKGDACCLKECGQCGGAKCTTNPNGGKNCCSSVVAKFGSCSTQMPPCSL